MPLARERSSWWDWWAFHEEEFLFLAVRTREASVTDRAAECIRGDAGGAFVGVTNRQRVERVRPSLFAFAQSTHDAATRSAALEALSRLSDDADGFVLGALRDGLADGDARCVEAAVLGLARTAPSAPTDAWLWALATDAAQGRALLQRATVPPHLRCLALQGLVAHAAPPRQIELRRSVLRLLKQILDEAGTVPHELTMAAVSGIGLLSSEQVVLASQGAEWLLGAYAAEPHASIRPDLVIALGRIARVLADAELRLACMAVMLDEAADGPMSAQRATSLALGRMSRSDDPLTPLIRRELLRLTRASPDPISRYLAVLSLARLAVADPDAERAAGFPIMQAMLDGLRSGHREERTWYALALGVMANQSADNRVALSPSLQIELVEAFRRTRSPEPAAACALALGLAQSRGVGEWIRERMERTASAAVLRAGAVALGLLGDRGQLPYLRGLVAHTAHDAETMRAAAVGLTLLGDFDVVPELLRTLQECSGSTSMERSLIASEVLGAIGDGRAVEPLLELLVAPALQPAVRVAVIRALGKLCSTAQPAWDAPRQDGAEFFPLTEAWFRDDDVGMRAAD